MSDYTPETLRELAESPTGDDAIIVAHADAWEAQLAASQEQVRELGLFVLDVAEHMFEDHYDYGDFLDAGLGHGILSKETFDPVVHSEHAQFFDGDPGDDIYLVVPQLAALRNAASEPPGEEGT